MDSNFFTTLTKTNTHSTCYCVSDINNLIKNCLKSNFPDSLQIRGEISNFVAHSSGHWYFTLKDSLSQIKVVMFKSANQKLNWQPKRHESLEVTLIGELSTYAPRGEYQIICQSLEKRGKGALREEFENLKIKLDKKGYFKNKKPLPFLPNHIVIISSPTGAAIKDILNILKRRYKGVEVTLIPSLVQGAEAAQSLIKALSHAQKIKTADVLILTRGGGSLEDLWAFNNEALAKALFLFPIPIISAIGHEIDITISDFVADLRAPTPSAAAELVVQNVSDLKQRIQKSHVLICQSITRELLNSKNHLLKLKQKIINPNQKIQEAQQYLDELTLNLKQCFDQQHNLKKQTLNNFISILNSLSPLNILKRGYSIVNKNNKIIKTAQNLKQAEEIYIRFSKSFAIAKIIKTGILKNNNLKQKGD